MTRPARYVDLKVRALREKCEESGLDNAGLRRDLIERLERKDRLIEESARKEKVRESERLRSQEKNSVGGVYQGSSSRAPSRQGRSRDIQRAEGEDTVGFEVTRSSFGFADDGRERPQMIFQNTARPRMASDPRADGQFDPLAPPPASSSNRDLPFRQRNEGPTHYRAERSITDLSEVELEDILFANYMPPQSEGSRLQRRMKIKAEHDVGVDVARSRKEASMKRLVAKYDIEVDKLRIERDEKLVELDRELGPKQEKSRHWFPAFNRLRALREARDLQTHPRDFAPRPAPYVIQPYRSAPAPQHPQLNARSFSPPRANFSSQPQPPVLKRKATSPLRSQYQAEGQNDHGRQPTTATFQANKRSCSDPARSHPSTLSHYPSTSSSTHSDAENLAHILVENTLLAPKLTRLPYIFVPATSYASFTELKALLKACEHTSKTSTFALMNQELSFCLNVRLLETKARSGAIGRLTG